MCKTALNWHTNPEMEVCKMKKDCNRVSVKEAAEMLGMSAQGVKEHMKRDLFNPSIGYVTQLSPNRKQYHIYRDMLERHIAGKTGEVKEADSAPKSQAELIGEIILQAIQQIGRIASN